MDVVNKTLSTDTMVEALTSPVLDSLHYLRPVHMLTCCAHSLGELTAGVYLLWWQSSWEPPIKANWFVIVSHKQDTLPSICSHYFFRVLCSVDHCEDSLYGGILVYTMQLHVPGKGSLSTNFPKLDEGFIALLLTVLFWLFNITVSPPSTLLQGWVDCSELRWSQPLHWTALGVYGLSWWWGVLLSDTIRPLYSLLPPS